MAKDLFIIKHLKPVKKRLHRNIYPVPVSLPTFLSSADFFTSYTASYLHSRICATTSFLLHIIHYWTMIKHFTQNQVILYYTPPCSWEAGRLDWLAQQQFCQVKQRGLVVDKRHHTQTQTGWRKKWDTWVEQCVLYTDDFSFTEVRKKWK